MTRDEVLDKAKEIISGDRDYQYGNPEISFTSIAGLWSVYLNRRVTPEQACTMMLLLKIAREGYKHKDDNIVDMAGYAACLADFNEETKG